MAARDVLQFHLSTAPYYIGRSVAVGGQRDVSIRGNSSWLANNEATIHIAPDTHVLYTPPVGTPR